MDEMSLPRPNGTVESLFRRLVVLVAAVFPLRDSSPIDSILLKFFFRQRFIGFPVISQICKVLKLVFLLLLVFFLFLGKTILYRG